MTLWLQANALLVEYSNAQLTLVDKKLWEDLKKREDKLGKHCRVKNIVIARAFPEKAGKLQQSINRLFTLVCLNMQF